MDTNICSYGDDCMAARLLAEVAALRAVAHSAMVFSAENDALVAYGESPLSGITLAAYVEFDWVRDRKDRARHALRATINAAWDSGAL